MMELTLEAPLTTLFGTGLKISYEEMLELARKMEQESAKDYNQWANECSANADAISKQLFEGLVADEEKHFDQYDTELDNIDRFGTNYLALQSIERSKSISSNPTGGE